MTKRGEMSIIVTVVARGAAERRAARDNGAILENDIEKNEGRKKQSDFDELKTLGTGWRR